jgi:hypothetical protein
MDMNKKVTLADKLPEIAAEWHPLLNGNTTPNDISPYSSRMVWWQCKNGHIFNKTVSDRVKDGKGRGCYECSKFAGKNDNSFADKYPELLKQWDFKKNKMDPYKIPANFHQEVWWKCENYHSFKMKISSRKKDGHCKICHSFGFLYPELAKFWDYRKNNGATPFDMDANVNVPYHWRCIFHEQESYFKLPSAVIDSPYAGCRQCMKINLASYLMHISLFMQWDYEKNYPMSPDYISSHSNKKVWWSCNRCHHSWNQEVFKRTKNIEDASLPDNCVIKGCQQCGFYIEDLK